MPPEPSNQQKRKRGRPPNASRQEEAAPAPAPAVATAAAVADEYDADADEERRPRKRGRPRKSMEPPAPEASPAPPSDPKPARRRGRPSLDSRAKVTQEAAVAEEEAAPPQTKRKRGRPSLGTKEAEATEDGGPLSRKRKTTAGEDEQLQEHKNTESRAGPRERRGRKGVDENQQPQQEQAEEPAADPTPRRKRGRPSLQDRQEAANNSEQAGEQRTKPRKRGRQSLQDIAPSDVQNKASKPSKAGRPPKADEATAASAADDTQTKKEGKRRRGRPSAGDKASTARANEAEAEADEPQRPRTAAAESQAGPAARSPGQKEKWRRSSQNAEPQDDDAPSSTPKPYPHIAPHVHRVRQSTIEAKWSPLAESSLSAASAILHLAHRPILQRLSNTQQRRTHTSAALRLITHRITRKIARGIPFPPASMTARVPRTGGGNGRGRGRAVGATGGDDGRAAELDFESVLDATQALERQLDPALHAVELLTREKEKLERELERDYEALRNLESSARAQAREHRGLLKKAHVLAPTPEVVVSQWKEKEGRDVIFRCEGGSTADGGLFDNLDDEEVKALALQLGSHAESMKNNLQQTDGILPQLARSRAALQDVLFRHLEQGQYEQVVLG